MGAIAQRPTNIPLVNPIASPGEQVVKPGGAPGVPLLGGGYPGMPSYNGIQAQPYATGPAQGYQGMPAYNGIQPLGMQNQGMNQNVYENANQNVYGNANQNVYGNANTMPAVPPVPGSPGGQGWPGGVPPGNIRQWWADRKGVQNPNAGAISPWATNTHTWTGGM